MGIDTSGVQANAYSPIPAGDYNCDIAHAEIRTTNKGDGQYVNVELSVSMPDGGTRTAYDVLLFDHPSETARNIGLARLRQLAESIGQDPANVDPDQMAGRPVRVKLGIDPKDTERNKVKRYDAASGSAPTPAPQQASAPAQPWQNQA